jgi:hypothetical protein
MSSGRESDKGASDTTGPDAELDRARARAEIRRIEAEITKINGEAKKVEVDAYPLVTWPRLVTSVAVVIFSGGSATLAVAEARTWATGWSSSVLALIVLGVLLYIVAGGLLIFALSVLSGDEKGRKLRFLTRFDKDAPLGAILVDEYLAARKGLHETSAESEVKPRDEPEGEEFHRRDSSTELLGKTPEPPGRTQAEGVGTLHAPLGAEDQSQPRGPESKRISPERAPAPETNHTNQDELDPGTAPGNTARVKLTRRPLGLAAIFASAGVYVVIAVFIFEDLLFHDALLAFTAAAAVGGAIAIAYLLILTFGQERSRSRALDLAIESTRLKEEVSSLQNQVNALIMERDTLARYLASNNEERTRRGSTE